MSLIGVPVAAEAAPELPAGPLLVLATGLAELAAELLPELLHPAASAAAAATAATVPIFVSLISD
jgi:hypothetical protein